VCVCLFCVCVCEGGRGDLGGTQGPKEEKKTKDKNTWKANELVDEAKRVQQKTNESLSRCVSPLPSCLSRPALSLASLPRPCSLLLRPPPSWHLDGARDEGPR